MPLHESISHMHLSANKRYEPQRVNNFEVTIYGLPGGAGAAKELTMAVSTFSKPNITNDPIEVPHGNSKVKFAGTTQFQGSETLEVVDYIGADIEKIVVDWHKQVYNPEDDTIGFAQNYKKKATITEFAPDGTMERSWTLLGLFPTGVNYGENLNYEGNEVKKIQMTLSYDKAYRN
ncbi:tail tube protein [Bacillus phage SP-15]|uniref:Tail tube protein n=1 Tax=Bacillus phage SP-15 TaxID=1792032 RepID=A0A127AW97_9CAUD|nr:tail tube protein [Bacillus phage SP-15]AMM44843.1 tail tube protein [Bacillus phage SP-15]